MVSMADLAQIDNFMHDEAAYALVGRRTGIRFQIGDRVKVKVAAANLENPPY